MKKDYVRIEICDTGEIICLNKLSDLKPYKKELALLQMKEDLDSIEKYRLNLLLSLTRQYEIEFRLVNKKKAIDRCIKELDQLDLVDVDFISYCYITDMIKNFRI